MMLDFLCTIGSCLGGIGNSIAVAAEKVGGAVGVAAGKIGEVVGEAVEKIEEAVKQAIHRTFCTVFNREYGYLPGQEHQQQIPALSGEIDRTRREDDFDQDESDGDEDEGEDEGEDEDEDEDEDEEDEGLTTLKSMIPIEKLAGFALKFRHQKSDDDNELLGLDCQVDPEPLYGSFNVLYRLKFSDLRTWVIKFPIACHDASSWDEEQAFRLRSEALTMMLVQSQTSIPVPTVFSFDNGFSNELGLPYILMEFLPGISAADFWKKLLSAPETERQAKRETLLRTLARYVTQLNKFKFDRDGLLDFTPDGKMIQGVKKPVDDPVPVHCIPATRNYLRRTLRSNLRDATDEDHFMTKGALKYLALLVDWFPIDVTDEDLACSNHFVLRHPDLDLQNVLVDDDGTVTGLIDWDGCEVVPSMWGNEAFPSWLTRDWDPLVYHYDGPEDNENEEDSPEELDYWRSRWVNIITDLFQSSPQVQQDAARRRAINSLLLQNLSIACRTFGFALGIGMEICKHHTAGISSENWFGPTRKRTVEFEPAIIFEALADDKITPAQIRLLRDAFTSICLQSA
ncbi:kinase-like domain-containing protein [Diplogelasinospora grovesii]|uniref:Kinase-like domain-containing protein n=1 Tax=Diplogelasinospora grovesii TaxID=303347 RepID=A0AAN6S848_9PEZI|nr:kinase-like domain-containing protein [Diplogelasinospora grovesii]